MNPTITLQPITLTTPTGYTPSRLLPVKHISYREFVTRYADRPRCVWMDGQPVTVYGFGLGGWWMVEATEGRER